MTIDFDERDRASVIDDLRMLLEKTRGNLAPDEQEHLDLVLKSLDEHLASPPEL